MPADKANGEMTNPGTARGPAWRTSSSAKWLDLFSEDFDHLPNSSGFEKFPIIPCSTESKLNECFYLKKKKIKQAVNMLMIFPYILIISFHAFKEKTL